MGKVRSLEGGRSGRDDSFGVSSFGIPFECRSRPLFVGDDYCKETDSVSVK